MTRRLYRAFPELDSYPDEQCARFEDAASGTLPRRAVRWVIVGLLSLPIWVVPPVAFFYWQSSQGVAPVMIDTGWRLWMALVLGLGGALVWAMTALALRDWLLRRRIRSILRAKALCAGCGYRLLGTPVSERHVVVCPECGLEGKVDPALGELVIGDRGQTLFSPATAKPPRILTPRFFRNLRRVALWGGIGMFFGLPALWGGYEAFLAWQSKIAASERVPPSDLEALVKDAQPAGVPSDAPDMWDTFAEIQAKMALIDAAEWKNSPPVTSTGKKVYPDFSSILAPLKENRSDEEKEVDEATDRLSRRLLEVYRDKGVYDLFREFSARSRAVRVISMPGGAPLITMLLPELGQARTLARLNSGRMKVAFEKGDAAEFGDALTSSLALGRMLDTDPFLISGLVSVAIDALAYSRVKEVLLTQPDVVWLDVIQRVLEAEPVRQGIRIQMKGERLVVLDSVAAVFSEPRNVRFGALSPGLKMFGGGQGPVWLGTYAGNKQAAELVMGGWLGHSQLPPWQRPELPAIASADENRPLLQLLTGAYSKAISSYDHVEIERRGVRVWIALERYRVEHGEYPASLSELVPRYLAEVPIDLWTGRELGYARRDPAKDAHGRGFVLYSAGYLGTDNGGAESSESPYMTLQPPKDLGNGSKSTPELFDFVINREE